MPMLKSILKTCFTIAVWIARIICILVGIALFMYGGKMMKEGVELNRQGDRLIQEARYSFQTAELRR